MVLTNQLIYLVNVKTMMKIFFKSCLLLRKFELFNNKTSYRKIIQKSCRWYNYMSQSTARYCDSSATVKPGLSMNILSITSFSSKLLTDSVLEMLSSKQDTLTPWLMRIVFFFVNFKKNSSLHLTLRTMKQKVLH